MDYHIIWYLIIGFLLMGYAVLDGFDLGVGILHLTSKGDHERRIMLNSIGPVWDGNEVWLITAGGAMFAAFPEVYATAFSSFYLPFMVLLFALIFRAVSIEFRSKEENPLWRKSWDVGFFLSSLVATFLYGVAIGNVINGIPIDQHKNFAGIVFDLISPYTLLTGLFNVSLFTMHGALYLNMKTEGDLQERIRKVAFKAFGVFFILYALLTIVTLFKHPEMLSNFSFGKVQGNLHPIIKKYHGPISYVAWTIVFLNMLAIVNIPRCLIQKKDGQAFISSACTILAVILFFALGMFPTLLPSTLADSYHLHIYNSASSTYTLRTMFWISIWGLPFVFGYTSLIYWTYKGKTRLGHNSY